MMHRSSRSFERAAMTDPHWQRWQHKHHKHGRIQDDLPPRRPRLALLLVVSFLAGIRGDAAGNRITGIIAKVLCAAVALYFGAQLLRGWTA